MAQPEQNGGHALSEKTSRRSQQPPKKPSAFKKLLAKGPPWLGESLQSPRAWKNFVRSMVAMFAMMVIMVDRKSMLNIGQTTFFGLMVSVIVPPSMPLAIYCYALLTMGIGMLLGWAWGVAAWAAAYSVRDKALLQRRMEAAIAQMDGSETQTAMITRLTYEGYFLEAGTSAVFGAFLFLGCYAMGWIRAKKPKLVLFTIFTSVIIDMNCSFGPLIPSRQLMMSSNMMKPAACFIAVGVASTVLMFPQTLNHLVLNMLCRKALQPIHDALVAHETVLATTPSDVDAWAAATAKVAGLGQAILGAFGQLEPQAKMLQLEISYGRISAGQLKELLNRTRDLGSKTLGLGALASLVDDRNKAMLRERPIPHQTSRIERQQRDFDRAEKEGGRALDDLIPALKESTAELREACEDGLQAGIDWLVMVNGSRWHKPPADFPPLEFRQAKLQKVREALRDFRDGGTNPILAPFEEMFDMSTGHLKEYYQAHLTGSTRGLFRCFTFTSTLVGFATALISFLELIISIDVGTPKSKLQFPGKYVQAVIGSVNDTSTGPDNYGMGDHEDLMDRDDNVEEEDRIDYDLTDTNASKKSKIKKKFEYSRDPDARDPVNYFQKFGRLVHRIWRGAKGDNGVFALKYGIVTMAVWTPAVCTNSAKFYYHNRGLWALIMAQTGLGVFAGEQLYNFILRFSGTIVGAVVGMVAWYIGAQKGKGNPYGVTAATMALTAPFLFVRINAPMIQFGFWLMVVMTIVFVVGYSWVDLHLPQNANQGAGYTLVGRRALLVIIGFACSLIMIMIPQPLSAKVVIRQGLSRNIAAIGELFGLEITALEKSRDDGFVDTEERRTRYRKHFLRIFARLGAIQHRMTFASLEPDLRGPWPKEQYQKLIKTQNTMLAASALLSSAYSQLEPLWCARLTDDSELMHPAFTADILSLFTILRHSLRMGDALPPIIPIFERLAYHHERSDQLIQRNPSFLQLQRGSMFRKPSRKGTGGSGNGDSETSSVKEDEDTENIRRSEAAVMRTLKHDVTWQSCHEEQFTIFATALIAILHMVGGLNSMHATILELVGERELEGFDSAHERWASAERWEEAEAKV